jgi:hypothetical protein
MQTVYRGFGMSPASFLTYLHSRRAGGNSLRTVAADFGVSGALVCQWLSGVRRPSKTILILAGLLAQRDSGNWPM